MNTTPACLSARLLPKTLIIKNNQWTFTQINGQNHFIDSNKVLKIKALKLMAKFSTQTQALVRGDLDTGSVMCYPSPRHDFEN